MKKSILATTLALSLGSGISSAADMTSATFIMLDGTGGGVGFDDTVTGSIGGGVWAVESTTTFFGSNWTAHDGTTFGPGTYTIDTIQGGTYTGVVVAPGQVGGHILFDWGVTADIDVVNVWDYNPITGQYTSTDGPAGNPPNPDGIRGYGMIDGAFPTFNANFDFQVLPPGTPTAGDFTLFALPGDVLINIDMLAHANDGGPPGTTLSLVSCDPVVGVTEGIVQTNMDNTCDYAAPAAPVNPDDKFTYIVFDSVLTSPPGTVTVDLVNEAPSCTNVSLTTSTNTDLAITEADLLENCTDPDGEEPLSVDAITLQPVHGTLSAALPPFIYTPDTDFIGDDSFDYTVSDTRSGTFTATADIQVSGDPFGNFTMLDAGGATFGGTNDIVATWDNTLNDAVSDANFNMTMASISGQLFFGFPWFAHHIQVFGPGTYTFDVTCSTAQVEQGLTDCGGGAGDFLTLTVGDNQIGAHMLFDWNVTENIDVANLWDANAIFPSASPAGAMWQGPAGPTPALDCLFEQASVDGDGDGVPGIKFIDGPFIGFRANYNLNFTQGCALGEVEMVKSSIKSSNAGGCTLSTATTTPMNRGDYWVMLGFIASLGTFMTRRRILNDK